MYDTEGVEWWAGKTGVQYDQIGAAAIMAPKWAYAALVFCPGIEEEEEEVKEWGAHPINVTR